MEVFAASVHRVARFLPALVLLGLAGASLAGESGPSGIQELDIEARLRLHHAERESVRLVQVPTVVTTRRGRPVKGLTKKDFRLLEDTIPQEIQFVGTDGDQPVSIAFLLDVSGSMRGSGKLDEAKHSIRVFVDSLRAEDQFGLVCFADDQVAWVTEFTSDRERFLRRLDVQQAYGQTALYDAIAAAPALVDRSTTGSQAIVLITDGIDTASQINTFQAIATARSANVPIYTIGFATMASRVREPGSRTGTERVLHLFAEETGGRLFSVLDPDELKDAVLAIQEELRFRYILGYSPSQAGWDGAFRRIKVETVRNRLKVRARRGYYARP